MDGSATVTRLTGVYDADGSLAGELRYLVGHALGRRHCALCDVTHGRLREKAAWREATAALPVPFRAVHLDEQDEVERAASAGRTPCVLAHTEDGVELLVGPAEIADCEGEPRALVAALQRALAGRL